MSIEKQIGYFFFNKTLFQRSLIHRSYVLEQQGQDQILEDQEAYQVLGQNVLETVITELLIRAGYATESEISVNRTVFLTEENLARISADLGVDFFVKLSADEKSHKANEQADILAGTLKAIVGGVYFDGGFSAAREVVRKLFQDVFPYE
jgi:ribonuclease III